jgi:hypothetical protein
VGKETAVPDLSSETINKAFATHKVSRLNSSDVSIRVQTNAPDKVDSVIVLQCKGDIVADTTRLLQPSFPVETLRVFDGELHGGLKFGPGKKTDDVVMNWEKPNQYIDWKVRANSATDYEVTVNYDADAESAGNTFTITFELPEKEKHRMPPPVVQGTVTAGKQQSQVVGRIGSIFANEQFEIKVAGKEIKSGELFRLRKLELRPVAQ